MELSIESFGLGLALGMVVGALAELLLRVVGTWIGAGSSGAPVPLGYLIGMRLRRTPAQLVVDAHVALAKRGKATTIDVVEAAYLANRSNVRSEQDLVRFVLELPETPDTPT